MDLTLRPQGLTGFRQKRETWPVFMRKWMKGGVKAEAGAGWGEQPAHCAGGGLRSHSLSISSYFCNSVFLKIPI